MACQYLRGEDLDLTRFIDLLDVRTDELVKSIACQGVQLPFQGTGGLLYFERGDVVVGMMTIKPHLVLLFAATRA